MKWLADCARILLAVYHLASACMRVYVCGFDNTRREREGEDTITICDVPSTHPERTSGNNAKGVVQNVI